MAERQKFTGERVTRDILKPGATDILRINSVCGMNPLGLLEVREAHLQRYRFARDWLRENQNVVGDNPRVLDIACGTGYGTDMLAEVSGVDVVGVDIDIKTAQEALTHSDTTAKFTAANGLELPFTDDTFDTIICFETIEHIPGPENFLGELSRILKSDGVIIISTPNREISNPSATINDQPENGFHEFELNGDEFEGLIRDYFIEVDVLGQEQFPAQSGSNGNNGLVDTILDKKEKFRSVFQMRQRTKIGPMRESHEPVYFVAVCKGKHSRKRG